MQSCFPGEQAEGGHTVLRARHRSLREQPGQEDQSRGESSAQEPWQTLGDNTAVVSGRSPSWVGRWGGRGTGWALGGGREGEMS